MDCAWHVQLICKLASSIPSATLCEKSAAVNFSIHKLGRNVPARELDIIRVKEARLIRFGEYIFFRKKAGRLGYDGIQEETELDGYTSTKVLRRAVVTKIRSCAEE